MPVSVHIFPRKADGFTVLLKKTKLTIISWLSLFMPKLAGCPCGWMAHTGDSRLRRHVGKARGPSVGFFLAVTLRTPLGSLPRNCANCTVQLYNCRGHTECVILSQLQYFTLYIFIPYHLIHQRMEDVNILTMAVMVEGSVYFIVAGDGQDTDTAMHAPHPYLFTVPPNSHPDNFGMSRIRTDIE